jgi:hypothetical protein
MLIQSFLTIQNQMKILHWQTKSYAAHKALGKAYEGLDVLIDNFIETYAGSSPEILNFDVCTIKCQNIDSLDPKSFLESVGSFLSGKLSSSIPEENTDLHNIKDEMIALVNKTKYLLTLE